GAAAPNVACGAAASAAGVAAGGCRMAGVAAAGAATPACSCCGGEHAASSAAARVVQIRRAGVLFGFMVPILVWWAYLLNAPGRSAGLAVGQGFCKKSYPRQAGAQPPRPLSHYR